MYLEILFAVFSFHFVAHAFIRFEQWEARRKISQYLKEVDERNAKMDKAKLEVIK